MPRTAAMLLTLLLAGATGCYMTAPSEPMGASVHQAMAAQTLYPGEPSTDPVTGFDGQAAQGTMQGYAKGFAPESSLDFNQLIKSMMEKK
ncbi:MAG: pilus assembly protein [Desulfovibrionaceae bacterium]|jgi:hypothetical protein|nr:pilus assembly protein [Desulfovibrionaceae bacterium]